jgi:hypothetical protein
MRTQYHFWPGETGLDAWDVDRLIGLSRGLPVVDVAVDTIREVDQVYWFDQAHPPTVRAVIEHARLIHEVDLSHLVILGVDGRVMDGMHRIARAIMEGAATIRDCDPATNQSLTTGTAIPPGCPTDPAGGRVEMEFAQMLASSTEDSEGRDPGSPG